MGGLGVCSGFELGCYDFKYHFREIKIFVVIELKNNIKWVHVKYFKSLVPISK